MTDHDRDRALRSCKEDPCLVGVKGLAEMVDLSGPLLVGAPGHDDNSRIESAQHMVIGGSGIRREPQTDDVDFEVGSTDQECLLRMPGEI